MGMQIGAFDAPAMSVRWRVVFNCSKIAFMKQNSNDSIPVIDLFAGPGGLSEGFSALQTECGNPFKICLSVEKDMYAHSTLELRSFFRQFSRDRIPEEYYSYLRKEISRAELFSAWPEEAEKAGKEVWRAELGSEGLSDDSVDEKIKSALGGSEKWVLTGGPPCQAYSTVGRSRNKGEKSYVPEKDKRHFLYREYLSIIARHWPSVFVLENVKGILSARVNGNNIFDHILEDLHDPLSALEISLPSGKSGYSYRIYSIVKSSSFPFDSSHAKFSPSDYLVMSEDYGIPQSRHRVILLGIREDMGDIRPAILKPRDRVNAASVLEGLPVVRSGLSREEDSFKSWEGRVREITSDDLLDSVCGENEKDVWDCIGKALGMLYKSEQYGRGGEFISCVAGCPEDLAGWYFDPRLKGVCNHMTKAHMTGDLHRYLFASCFAKVHGKSPTLPDFPEKLWPEHRSAQKSKRSEIFSDRFRVQMASKPSTTVMSHIAKDGHYYIHYDASQCRSLTVREVARLQTFPDNYFFEGPRTQQYIQVGNAVPPLLAFQVAEKVHDIFSRIV